MTQISLTQVVAKIRALGLELRGAERNESPLFVMGAGSQTAVPLLQRMLAPECWTWGGTHDHTGLVQSLADPLRSLDFHGSASRALADASAKGAGLTSAHATQASLVVTLVDAHRAFFKRLLIQPAREANAGQWGLISERLGAEYAWYLQLLFPRSKFLFVIRNPYDAYREWAARRNASRLPDPATADDPITARQFGRTWCELAAGFVAEAGRLDAHLLRFEDLQAERLDAAEAYLGFPLRRAARRKGSDIGPAPIELIPEVEMAELGSELHALAQSLDYGNPASPSHAFASGSIQPSLVAANAASPSHDPSRCAVLVPVGGQIVPACEAGLLELERRGYVVHRVRGYSAIDQGRNQMATDALADGFAETMWIDSDVGFDPDDVEKLRLHNLPIVCAIYPQKGRRVLACHLLPGTETLIFGEGGGVTEILYAGTGFLLVRREAYDTIRRDLKLPLCNERFGGRPMVPFFQPMSLSESIGHWYLAEDFAFCERARQAGFTIYADSTVRLMHYGNYGYSWEDAGLEFQRFRTFHFQAK